MATIKTTKNYNLFKLHTLNREVLQTKVGFKNLIASMEKYGFLDSMAITVFRERSGALVIKAGHHRFLAGQKLNLPIKYIIENEDISIHELEKSTTIWRLRDYLYMFVQAGYHSYQVVKAYCDRTGIGLNNAISLLGGQSAGSGNFSDVFKNGTYELSDPQHASVVENVVMHCKQCRIPFATQASFVAAISKIVWVREFDHNILKHKINTFAYLIEKQSGKQAYIDMLDRIYNRQSKNKIPLSFLADEAAKERADGNLKRNKKR